MLTIRVSGPGETVAEAPSRATAIILAFPARKPNTPRFSDTDRATLANHAREGSLPPGLDVDVTDDSEFGEYASFTRRGNSWSEWNVAPQDGRLALWSGRLGVDLGNFESMYCVFGALDRAISGRAETALKITSGRVPCPAKNGDASIECSCASRCACLRMAS